MTGNWNVACRNKLTGKGTLCSYYGYKTKREATDIAVRGNELRFSTLEFTVVKRIPGTDHYEKPVW